MNSQSTNNTSIQANTQGFSTRCQDALPNAILAGSQTVPAAFALTQTGLRHNVPHNYTDRDLHSVASYAGSYCSDFPASAYETIGFDGIWAFEMTINGVSGPAYCMEKGITGPSRDPTPFVSSPITDTFPGISGETQRRLAWIMANAYPALTADNLFVAAGVDPDESPQLDVHDAYAVTQVALWQMINPKPKDELVFLNCGTQTQHPKHARLLKTLEYLLTQSAQQADDFQPPAECSSKDCHVSISSSAQLVDCGSAEDMRFVCGKWLYGPLRVDADAPFDISLEPCCAERCITTFAGFADACGIPIDAPEPGREFYIALPDKALPMCYTIRITTLRVVVTFAYFRYAGTDRRIQTLSHIVKIEETPDELVRCFCASRPSQTDKDLLACLAPLLTINNNNNNAWGGGGSSPYPPCPPYPPGPCPPGTEYVPGQGCVPIPLPCPPGTHPTPEGCEPDILPCPPGTHPTPEGCEPDILPCPPGSHFVPGVGCVADEPVCPPGSHKVPGGGCEYDSADCPPGSHYVAGVGCVSDRVVCPPGSCKTPDGKCEYPASCPPGSRCVPGVGCVYDAVACPLPWCQPQIVCPQPYPPIPCPQPYPPMPRPQPYPPVPCPQPYPPVPCPQPYYPPVPCPQPYYPPMPRPQPYPPVPCPQPYPPVPCPQPYPPIPCPQPYPIELCPCTPPQYPYQGYGMA